MLKPNNENSNQQITPLGGLASNTRSIPPNTTPTTVNKSSKATANNELQLNNSTEESLTVFHNHLDWLTLNFTGLTEEKFNQLLRRTGRGLITLEKNQSWSSGEKAKNYQNTITSPIGLKGAYSHYQIENSVDIFYDGTIALSGEYFTSVNTVEQWELCRDLYSNYSIACSRADVSIDDYSFKNIPLNEMIEAYKKGDYFDFRELGKQEEYTSPDNLTTTYYFGSKGSKKLVRVYTHKNESLRLETQFRGKYAEVAFEVIATLKRESELDEEWTKIVQKTIGGIAIGVIDFRDKSKLKNQKKADKSKTKRLPFWQDFIDKVGVVHLIKIQPKEPDLTMYQEKFNWLEKVTSKLLAIAYHVLGRERFIAYINRLVTVGENKLTKSDRKQIEYLRDNLEYLDLG
jgi:hypothetical protein